MVPTATQLSRAPRVLIVDDEPLIRWALAETLTTAGMTVREAATGDAAAHALTDGADLPDVVFLDYQLPDVTGLELLSTIKVDAPHCQTILMTAYGTPEIMQQALDLGALRVVDKPFDMTEVPGLVQQAYDASQAEGGSGAF